MTQRLLTPEALQELQPEAAFSSEAAMVKGMERGGDVRGCSFFWVRACLTPGKTQLLPWAAEPTLATSLHCDRAQRDPGGQRWENQ